jgi:hypothetical protein
MIPIYIKPTARSAHALSAPVFPLLRLPQKDQGNLPYRVMLEAVPGDIAIANLAWLINLVSLEAEQPSGFRRNELQDPGVGGVIAKCFAIRLLSKLVQFEVFEAGVKNINYSGLTNYMLPQQR